MANVIPIQHIVKRLRLSTTIEELLQLNAITIRTYNGCKSNGFVTLGSILHLTPIDIMKWHGCGRKVVAELGSIIEATKSFSRESSEENDSKGEAYSDMSPHILKIQKKLFCLGVIDQAISILQATENHHKENNITLSDIQKLASCLSSNDDTKEELLPINLSSFLDNLGAPEYQSTISLFETSFSSLLDRLTNLSNEISNLIKTSDVVRESQSTFARISRAISLKDDFPFLLDKEIEFCIGYTEKFDDLPKIYILYKSLIRSNDRQAQMLCYRYGLYADAETKSLDELAEMFKLTRERVRQLTDADGKALKKVSPEGLVCESDFSDIMFMSENDEKVSTIINDQNLNISTKQLIILIDILSKRLGSSSFVKDGITYLYSWELWERINFEKIDAFIKENVPSKRTENIEVSLTDIIKQSDTKCDEDGLKFMKQIISCYLSDTLSLSLNEGERYFWEQTHVSNEEILEIVADNDAIITTEEILSECENRFPGLKCTYIDISQNPYLSAVGLKGYVPKSERARYFSSIGDCISAILNESRRPMSTSELLDEVLERGNVTNLNSLRSLLSRKEENRFTRFVGDLWGLNGYEYSDEKVSLSTIVKRKSFNEHLSDLKDFVLNNHRMPTTTKGDDEASIVRWIRNVQNDNIDVSADEKQRLDLYLSDNKDVPQNSIENRFLQNCITYRKVVAFLGKRPSIESRPQLCMWFYTSIKKKDTLSFNCKRWFNELLEWLEEEGIYFGD